MTTTRTETIPTMAVRAGDMIAEMDTPSGPFYPVLKVNAKSFVVNARAVTGRLDGAPLPIRIPRRDSHGVLRVIA